MWKWTNIISIEILILQNLRNITCVVELSASGSFERHNLVSTHLMLKAVESFVRDIQFLAVNPQEVGVEKLCWGDSRAFWYRLEAHTQDSWEQHTCRPEKWFSVEEKGPLWQRGSASTPVGSKPVINSSSRGPDVCSLEGEPHSYGHAQTDTNTET